LIERPFLTQLLTSEPDFSDETLLSVAGFLNPILWQNFEVGLSPFLQSGFVVKSCWMCESLLPAV